MAEILAAALAPAPGCPGPIGEPPSAPAAESSVARTPLAEPDALPVRDLSDPPRFLISDLLVYLESYLPPEQISEVYRAYLFGAEAHEGQRRKSGEPYIYHPLAVARILGEMRMDYKCLIAAMLHDVIEDTRVAKDQLAAAFDDEIAELVDGVSKLSQIDFQSRAEAQAASLQKMLLAMTRDIRVILIKLADRLHNMRTLGSMRPESRRRISRETLDIFAPIANRLGINKIRVELEDLGFSHYWPWRHLVLHRAVERASGARQELLVTVETAIKRRLHQEDIPGEVQGRRKNLYSIYRKMREKRRSFSDLVDVFGFRVTVDKVDTCYRVLGQVHNLYKPVPGRFKDYIAIPKANGYQSLHTVLFGPQGVPIEIQIRTEHMQRNAESGIAAHWMYKTGSQSGPPALAAEWLQNLLEMQRGAGNSVEFLEHVKVDLFPDEVYVFTPKGRILTLKRGATLVDFAYAIHSDVGNRCVAGRIDRRLASLGTALRSGQTVEIITAPGAKPNPSWLGFVVTGKARAGIRGYLKNLKQLEAQALGRRLLGTELANLGTELARVAPARIADYLKDAGLADTDALLGDIGLGNRLPVLVARRLAGDTEPLTPDPSEPPDPAGLHPHRLAIRGTEGMVVSFARCCRPIPGDGIAALFSPGRGIVVHRHDCGNLGSLETKRDKRLEVEWAAEPDGDFPVEIRVEIGNRRGALAVVAGAIAEQGSNIENVQSREKDGMTTALELVISVRNRRHLARIMRRLRQIPLVVRITRVSR